MLSSGTVPVLVAFLDWGEPHAVGAFHMLFVLCGPHNESSSDNLNLVARLHGLRRLSSLLRPRIPPYLVAGNRYSNVCSVPADCTVHS